MTVLVYLSLCFVILKKCCKIYGFFTPPNTDERPIEEFEQKSLLNTVAWWHVGRSQFNPFKRGSNQVATSHLSFQGGQCVVSPTIIWKYAKPRRHMYSLIFVKIQIKWIKIVQAKKRRFDPFHWESASLQTSRDTFESLILWELSHDSCNPFYSIHPKYNTAGFCSVSHTVIMSSDQINK